VGALAGDEPAGQGGRGADVMPKPSAQVYDEVCERPMTATCAICAGPACAVCDICHGCGQTICDYCDSDPDLEPVAFPGDTGPHPHSTDFDTLFADLSRWMQGDGGRA
jgi:hypothetical protein